MAVKFPRLPPWLWRKHTPDQSPSFPNAQHSVNKQTAFHKSPRSRREKRCLDPEFDVVLVPSDGDCCLSDSESDDSDWSVGWFEPHESDFCSETGSENSFAVLVRCYGSPSPDTRGKGIPENDKKPQRLAAVPGNLSNGSTIGLQKQCKLPDNKNHLEQWLSSLQIINFGKAD